jgi:dUTP pyrophosphatase
MKIKLIKNAQMPKKGREGDAAWDVYLLDNCYIPANTGFCLDTGICLELDPGYAAIFVPRSSTAKKGISISDCLIDSNYRGEVHILGMNQSCYDLTFNKGDRMASLLIFPIYNGELEQVEELSESNRGNSWNGSSGK